MEKAEGRREKGKRKKVRREKGKRRREKEEFTTKSAKNAQRTLRIFVADSQILGTGVVGLGFGMCRRKK